jgi:hypothetical protein
MNVSSNSMVCQQAAMSDASCKVGALPTELLRIRRCWKMQSFPSFLRGELAHAKARILRYLGLLRPMQTATRVVPVLSHTLEKEGNAALDLMPGELVRVRSRAEIQRTLDNGGRVKGLFFMPGMWQFCGKEFRVYKQVRKLQIESTGEVRQLKNTVLLEGAVCEGSVVECDRSCFYFWREAWLERVDLTSRAEP